MMRPFWRRVLIVSGVALAVAIVGVLAFNTYAILSEDDGEPETHLAQPTDAATPDVPRYTDEEVIAKIRDYQFAVTYDDGTEELWTVTNMTAAVISIEGGKCMALGPLAYEMMQGPIDVTHCGKQEESASYEGNGRWSVVLTFAADNSVSSRADARFSFREDTGEIIPLNVEAQNLMGRGQ